MPLSSIEVHHDCTPEELAKHARLRYVSHEQPGYRRLRVGRGFRYVSVRGRKLTGAETLERIQQLAIPPAWSDVWICRYHNGHLQATGFDDRERRQYLYHERWSEISNLAKFTKLDCFGRALPRIRSQVAQHLNSAELTEASLAVLLVAFLDRTGLRIGNEEYAASNGSYGLTTLRKRHVALDGCRIRLRFRGKSGLRSQIICEDEQLTRFVKQLMQLPGSRVFQYRTPDGALHPADSHQVNEFLAEISGQSFTAKDFRTWKASTLAAGCLFQHRDEAGKTKRRSIVLQAVDEVAEALGNTRAVCRKYYIHPVVLDSFATGKLVDVCSQGRPRKRKWLSRDEQILMRLLQQTG